MAKAKFPKKSNGKEAVPMSAQPPVEAVEAAAVSAAVTEASAETRKTAPRRARTAKPEIVKSEPRANLVPINLEDEIRQAAYLLSERRGFEPGHEAEDWVSAEREVLQGYQQQSASAAAGASA